MRSSIVKSSIGWTLALAALLAAGCRNGNSLAGKYHYQFDYGTSVKHHVLELKPDSTATVKTTREMFEVKYVVEGDTITFTKQNGSMSQGHIEGDSITLNDSGLYPASRNDRFTREGPNGELPPPAR